MRIPLAIYFTVAITATSVPAQLRAQLPSGCSNNETSRCAERIPPSTIIEGLAGGPGNRDNYFEVEVLRPGIYLLETTKERAPSGGRATLRISIVDNQGNVMLDTWFNGSMMEKTDLVEIDIPGKYRIRIFHSTGSIPTPFTLRFRPRPRN